MEITPLIISRIEKNQRHVCDAELKMLAKALGVSHGLALRRRRRHKLKTTLLGGFLFVGMYFYYPFLKFFAERRWIYSFFGFACEAGAKKVKFNVAVAIFSH